MTAEVNAEMREFLARLHALYAEFPQEARAYESEFKELLDQVAALAARLAEAEQLLKAAVDAWRGDGPPLELDRIDAFLATTDSASVQHEPDPPYGSEAYLFRELMAIMHGDGGHYHAQHGAQKAYEDACTKYWRLVVTAEKTAKDVRATDEAGVTTDRETVGNG